MVAPVGLFGKHRYMISGVFFGSSGAKLLSAKHGMYITSLQSSVSLSYVPVLPAITFESTYTGYTGSHTAILLSAVNISWIFAESLFAPSLTNISSADMSTPLSA